MRGHNLHLSMEDTLGNMCLLCIYGRHLRKYVFTMHLCKTPKEICVYYASMEDEKINGTIKRHNITVS